MSLIKDWDDLKLGSKWTALNIVSTIPFFFVIFYLFNQGRIKLVCGNPFGDIDFYYILSVCFCLALLWFMINFVVSSILVSIFDRIEQNDKSVENQPKISSLQNDKDFDSHKHEGVNLEHFEKEDELHTEFIVTYIYSILYLAIAILLNNIWFKFSFKSVILITFCFAGFRVAYVLIIDVLLAKIFRKMKKTP